MRRKPFVTVAMLSLCSVMIGCGPAYSVSRYGVRATLVDAGSKKPLARTETRIAVDRATFHRISSRHGSVNLHAERQWHLTWLGGPMWASDADAEIEIEPSGYQKISFKWLRYLPNNSPMAKFHEEEGVIDLGTIEVKKR